MGFLNELGKAFMGKPLGPSASAEPSVPQDSQQDSGVLDANGRKIIPDIEVKNLRSHRQGEEKLRVTAWLVNKSSQEIRIDTTYLLKQKRQPNQILGSGQSHELVLYDGQIPDNDNEHQAQITYRLQANGDVFMENYRIKYDLESDGKQIVGDLIDDGPVRDI